MKRAVESNGDFVIPKKTRSDLEPDLYSQVIRDDQHNEYSVPTESQYQMGYNQTGFPLATVPPPPSFTGPNPGKDMNLVMQYPTAASGPYYTETPNETPKVETETAVASGSYYTQTPVETPKVETATLPNVGDRTLPKVLTMQFQPLFCKLCNLQLNSNIMAKLHYESKKHNRKVQLFLIEYAEETGEPLHPKATPDGFKPITQDNDPRNFHCTVCDLPLTGRMHAESHYMGKNHRRALAGHPPAGRGHFDPTGKWVREIPLKDGLDRDSFGIDFVKANPGVPIAPHMKKDLKVEDLQCELCKVAVTSDEQMTLHINGQKHQRRWNMAMGYSPMMKSTTGGSTILDDQLLAIDLSSYRTPSGNFYCEPCNTVVNGDISFKQHLSSKKHKKAALGGPKGKAVLQPSLPTKLEMKTVYCNVCQVSLTSERQLMMHNNGMKHRKLSGENVTKMAKGNGVSSKPFSKGPEDQQCYNKYRTPSGLYYCKRCDLTVNTEAQFKAHITGKTHWSKVPSTALASNATNKS